MPFQSYFSPLKRFPLWLLIALSFCGCLLISFWFPLYPYHNLSPLPDIRAFTPSLLEGGGYALLLGVLWGLYGEASQRVRHMARPPHLIVVLLTAVLLALPLLFTFPINATDIYRYIIRGRVSSVYHENPFVVPPADFPEDPFALLAGEWQQETSPYGPIWEGTAWSLTAVSQGSLYLGLLFFKVFGLLTHLAIACLLWHLLPQQKSSQRLNTVLLWAWNPALLLIFVVDAHNDAFMLLWLLLGLWFIQKERFTLGMIIMILAPLTKPIGLLPLPFFFLAVWRQLPTSQARLRFLVFSVGGGLLVSGLAFFPFGSPLALVQRLVREASAGGGFSPTALLILLNHHRDLGFSPYSFIYATQGFAGVAGLVLVWQTWRGRSPISTTAVLFALYILQALNFRIWYSTWLLPWLMLHQAREPLNGRAAYQHRVGHWFLMTTQLSVLIYGHLRVYALDNNYLYVHLIGIPFTFGLPFLLAVRRRSRRSTPALPAATVHKPHSNALQTKR